LEVLAELKERARARCPRIVFAEGDDPTIVKAALRVLADGIARPILVRTTAAGPLPADAAGIEAVDPRASRQRAAYARSYAERESFPERPAAHLLKNPVNFAAAMAGSGDADGLVAGFTYGTAAVIIASRMFIGMRDGVSTPSSFFLMDVPGWSGPEGRLLIFADCAVNPNPTAEELADIALSTAASARALLGWIPRVAMLSFSTRGSASHPDVDKVVAALQIAREREPALTIDGEMQVDAALIPAVAEKKMDGEGAVGGRANILVFPDLDAGNIAYKLVQRLASAAAYGPVFQGFRRPVSDLSKGASIDDIVGATIIVAALSEPAPA